MLGKSTGVKIRQLKNLCWEIPGLVNPNAMKLIFDMMNRFFNCKIQSLEPRTSEHGTFVAYNQEI